MSEKINVFSLIWQSMCAVKANYRALLVAMIIPGLAVAAIQVTDMHLWDYLIDNSIMPYEDEENMQLWYAYINLALASVATFFVAMFSVACHQIIVLGSDASTGFLGFSLKLRVFKYYLWSMVITAIVVIYHNLASTFILDLYSYEDDTFLGLDILSFESLVAIAFRWVPESIDLACFAIAGLIFPSVAIEGKANFRASLSLAKGYFLSIFFSIAIFRTAEYLVSLILSDYLYPYFSLYDSVFLSFCLAAILFGLGVFNISVLSILYKIRKEGLTSS